MTATAEMTMERHEAVRTCVGCRQAVPCADIVRFAIGDQAPFVVPDLGRKLGGRGVSVHPNRKCIELAVKKGGFARALERSVSLNVSDLCAQLSSLLLVRSMSLILAAARRKKLAIGTEAVRQAIREARIALLVVASDAEGRREELEALAARLGRRCVVVGEKAELGRMFGRDEVGVLGVLEPSIGDEITKCAEQRAGLAEAK